MLRLCPRIRIRYLKHSIYPRFYLPRTMSSAEAPSSAAASTAEPIESSSADGSASAASEAPGGTGAGTLSKNAQKNQAKREAAAAKAAEKAAKAAEAASRAAAEPAPAKEKTKKKAVEAYEFTNTTPPGEKKDMSGEMLAAYHPQAVEAAWDAWWTAQGFYKPDVGAAKAAGEGGRFVMVIPPPNVTGSLHLGHALTDAIEDCLARWHRMSGRPTLWLPGTDHAGIATQTVVEKRLAKERSVTRHDLGREAFVAEVWKWKEQYGSRITSQMRSLGTSTDWSRERFTMDDGLSNAVKEAFVRLHGENLIYRDTRLVNWCCALESAISDIEVEEVELEKKSVRSNVPGHAADKNYLFGLLWEFAYKVKGSNEEIVVATTRPETMLGDTAVAVHPDDPRYKHLHGAELVHPFIPDRHIRVICDNILVDMSFGTGAVKITPAHDPNDFLCGKRHNLEFITVIDKNGKINANGGRFAGMPRFDARNAVIEALEKAGLYKGRKDNKMVLRVCSRTGDVIEPLIAPQWYVRCEGMGKAALKAVTDGELRLVPAEHETTWKHWLANIQDWCISRQLWWGHRIPAYLVTVAGRAAPDEADPNNWVVARTPEEAAAAAATRFGVPPTDVSLRQDEDVLDTWFSSALFPFATMGWPDTKHPDFQAFYPNTLLETGHDILFFWVARMVMMGQALTGQLPFKTVYLHAMVRDKNGKKMSKSLGNIIDPLEVIYGCSLETLIQRVQESNLDAKEKAAGIAEKQKDFKDGIPECGADALRFGLLAYTLQGRDISLDVNRVIGYRQFCNKLWNAVRFAMLHFQPEKGYTYTPLLDGYDQLAASAQLAPRDRWILSRLTAMLQAVDAGMASYSFAAVTAALYDFWLYEFCDYYLELVKPLLNPGGAATPEAGEAGATAAAASAGGDVPAAAALARLVLYVCLDAGLRALHPMMPFVTEELWQRMPGRGAAWRADGSVTSPPSIMIAPYPRTGTGAGNLPSFASAGVEADFEAFKDALKAGRNLRSEAELLPAKEAAFVIVATTPEARRPLEAHARDLITLLKASSLAIVGSIGDVTSERTSAAVVSDVVSIYMKLEALDPRTELARLKPKLGKLDKDLEQLVRREGVKDYETKVPSEVREKNAAERAALEKQIEVLKGLIAGYEAQLAAAPASAAAAP